MADHDALDLFGLVDDAARASAASSSGDDDPRGVYDNDPSSSGGDNDTDASATWDVPSVERLEHVQQDLAAEREKNRVLATEVGKLRSMAVAGAGGASGSTGGGGGARMRLPSVVDRPTVPDSWGRFFSDAQSSVAQHRQKLQAQAATQAGDWRDPEWVASFHFVTGLLPPWALPVHPYTGHGFASPISTHASPPPPPPPPLRLLRRSLSFVRLS